jgi:hypothetical protein
LNPIHERMDIFPMYASLCLPYPEIYHSGRRLLKF